MDKIQALDLVISDPFSILSFTLSMFGAFVLGYLIVFHYEKYFPHISRSQSMDKTILTIEKPNDKIRLYPRLDEKNISLFNKYLNETAKIKNVISFGRLGLYKYLTSDTTIEMVFRLKKIINMWTIMSSQKRVAAYKKVRGDWNN